MTVGPVEEESDDPLLPWLRVLDSSPLPILAHTGKVLISTLQDENVALSQLTKLIVQDPAACLHVLRKANWLSHRGKHSDIISISHCVSVIGFEELKGLLSSLPILKDQYELSSVINYTRSIMRSLHAATQARHWAMLRSQANPEHVFLTALLYGAPLWALWQTAPAEMKIVEHLILNEKVPVQEAEKSVLGLSVASLAQNLACLWGLPTVVQEAYDPSNQPMISLLLHYGKKARAGQLEALPAFDEEGVALNSPAAQVLLANWLAVEADVDWYSRQMQRCLGVIAAYLNLPLEQVWKQVRAEACNISRAFPLPGIITPGERFLLSRDAPKRRKIKPSQLAGQVQDLLSKKDILLQDGPMHFSADQALQVVVESIEHNNNIQFIGDQAFYKSFLDRMRLKPDSFATLHELLESATEALQLGLGFARVAVLLKEREGNLLHAICYAGDPDQSTLDELVIDLETTNLFTKLLLKSTALWVGQGENASLFKLLPNNFKQASGEVDSFFVRSIFNQKKPLGVLYVDAGQGHERSLCESQYKNFRLFCKLMAQCIRKVEEPSL